MRTTSPRHCTAMAFALIVEHGGHGSTVAGDVVVRATVNGFPGEIKPEAALTLRGRVASMELSDDILIVVGRNSDLDAFRERN